MISSSSHTDHMSALVLDSSVLINLLATKHFRPILNALSVPLIVTTNVLREIELGATDGRSEFGLLEDLISDKILRVEELKKAALEDFFRLVSGRTSESLGDGEASTLAFAQHNDIMAAIDEKKATRFAAERFPTLKLLTTVDILASTSVHKAISKSSLAEATLDALRYARMQVREHQFDWVVKLVGQENVNKCPSLKRHAKRSFLI